MKVFHLSHIDLDGYGAQMVSSEFFSDITFFNANYGREVGARINAILALLPSPTNTKSPELSFEGRINLRDLATSQKEIKKDNEKYLILITDLNLTMQESKFLSQKVKELKLAGIDIELVLLDHHATGEECAKNYSWYNLDINRCATKITFDYLLEHYKLLNPENLTWLTPVVQMINSVDIWKEDEFGFEFGKVALNMIAASNELSRMMFDAQDRALKLSLIRKTKDYLVESNTGLTVEGKVFDEVSFDNDLFFIKKALFEGDAKSETMGNILARYQVSLLSKQKQRCTVKYKDKLGFLSYGVGNISILANTFLNTNPEFDFYMDVSPRGNVSLRANGNCDVSALSQACFNGGGHKNASGGRIDSFRESFFYDDIKEQIQGHLSMKDEWEL
ncbi:3',5'-cyclic-nucleotide phosphodiesterase [Helicobacter sp. 11S02629-2]|uniref:DHH family phosphoesterase n=1 Tax=Helicobacter sp. 11S02629-2 TaxID=1476195 RepID=UPI000BA6BB69|nr:3',5'-cyclic-nucleotide phosphodiesterase [Helicobacter sp. 11S02629-2]PAF42155.1 phosphoesterase [Helicobacter sp. 11S02629-2]